MRHDAPRCLLTWAALLCLVLVGSSGHAHDPDDPDNDISTRILLELAPGVRIETIASRYDLTTVEHFPELRTWLVEVAPGSDAEEVEEQLDEEPDVVDVETEEIVEPPEGDQRSIPDLGLDLEQVDFLEQWGARTIRTGDAHVTHTGRGIVVAVLDNGIGPHAAELDGRLVGPGADFAGGDGTTHPQPDGIDNDGDGLVDEGVHHGTFVAGLVRLAAPDAVILPVRVLSAEGRGTLSGLAKGILFAVSRHADVINISLGTPAASELVEKAIEFAESRGAVVVASAGNDGSSEVGFPARLYEVIAVAAVSETLEPSVFTNTGEEVVVSAPGEGVLSTVADNVDYGGWAGTSFATPLVSGGVAVLLERYPGLSTSRVREVLAQTATPFPGNPPDEAGAGVLNLSALTTVLQSDRETLSLDGSAQGTVVRFSPVLEARHYDLVRGELDRLTSRDDGGTELGTLVCLLNDGDVASGLTVTDGPAPAPGRGFFYLFRDDIEDSYGEIPSGDREPGTGDCPTE